MTFKRLCSILLVQIAAFVGLMSEETQARTEESTEKTQTQAIDRVEEIRTKLLKADSLGLHSSRELKDDLKRSAQWGNWLNWPNWNNWMNWPNWRNF